jgi:DNA-binding transcriptional ArsR family regulator
MGGMQSFMALADPTRRRILEMLAGGQLAAGEIAGRFEVSAPAISQHLKVLRQTHLVRVRAEAQRRIYELDPRGLDELESWVARLRSFWSGRLDELERQLRKENSNRRRRKKR